MSIANLDVILLLAADN